MNARLFTTQQAAQLIGFTDSRLRQLVASGQARPKAQLGGTWIFTLAEVNCLCTRRKAGRPSK